MGEGAEDRLAENNREHNFSAPGRLGSYEKDVPRAGKTAGALGRGPGISVASRTSSFSVARRDHWASRRPFSDLTRIDRASQTCYQSNLATRVPREQNESPRKRRHDRA